MNTGEILLRAQDTKELDKVDEEFMVAVTNHDNDTFFDYGRTLCKEVQLRGMALMKFIYIVYTNQDVFDSEPEDTLQIELNLKPDTTRKYYRAWRNIFANTQIPEDVKERLLGKPTRSLLLLSSVAAELPEEIDWEEIVSGDEQAIRSTVHRLRGEATSSANSIYIQLNRDNSLTAKRGMEGKSYPIGYLLPEDAVPNDEDGNAVRNSARRRIIERCAVYEC